MKVKISDLQNLIRKALRHYGYTKEEAQIIEDVLLYAQLRGNNQGIVKLIGKGMPKDPEARKLIVSQETKLSALINGNNNAGMVVMKEAMEIALRKAKRHGFGIVGTHNTNTSTGAIGYYAREIARRGFLGFVFAGSPETVCTHGSYEPIFGTNPLAIGIPSEDDPVVLDMATAAMAYYGLIEAKTAGRSIPGDIAYDSDGKLTADPARALQGALRPFDRSYKGAGLALMIEILTGPLVSASFAGIGDTAANWGNLIFVLDPELLTDHEAFKQSVSQLVAKVKGTKKLLGVEEIFVPGERGNRLTKERLSSGEIEIEDNLYLQLTQVANG